VKGKDQDHFRWPQNSRWPGGSGSGPYS
jgi:hypothetical protein